MNDVYHFCKTERLCPEAPAPIFIETHKEIRRGGADNVANQLEALGCKVTTLFSSKRSTKHRYFVGNHMVFRLDEDKPGKSPEFVNNLNQYDVIVLSDYSKGFLSLEFCQNIIRKAVGYGIPVVVDPKGADWTKYHGCTAVCPNSKEYAGWQTGGPFDTVCVKRGEHGIDLLRKGREPVNIPARARHVFDVTGAGDTVVAAISATLGVNKSVESIEQGCHLGVIAAGEVIEQVGTAVCSRERLLELIYEQA